MSHVQFTSINTVIAKFYRDLKGASLNETDAIEWIGEALGFMRVPDIHEQTVAFMEVKNHEADLPPGFHAIIQIARNNRWSATSPVSCTEIIESVNTETVPVPIDWNGKPITDYEVAYYRPFFNLQWEYSLWTASNIYKEDFTPVRLADHSFFKNVVCKETNQEIYNSCVDEYTIVGTTERKLRFSFKSGYVAMAYYKSVTDEDGYPLIPDEIRTITAITYYLKWKIAERYAWNGREGFNSIAQDNERKWNKYVKQAKNYGKMPKTLDDFQDLMEQSHYLIPRRNRYYGFFGKLSESENLQF